MCKTEYLTLADDFSLVPCAKVDSSKIDVCECFDCYVPNDSSTQKKVYIYLTY